MRKNKVLEFINIVTAIGMVMGCFTCHTWPIKSAVLEIVCGEWWFLFLYANGMFKEIKEDD